ncbi:MAG: porin family protein [Bacteroidaceae bacterium]|nr:porin family protein [Bacteroidaceae bacterium]
MKKLSVILGFIAIVCMPASAQFAWGIRGGLNLVSNDISAVSKESVTSKDSYTGFFVGPMAEFQLPVIGIGIDASLLYSQKGLQLAQGEDVKNESLSVPLYLKYTFGLGNFLGVFAQAGVQFDYKIGDLEQQFNIAKEGQADRHDVQEFILNQNTWSANIGAGIKLIDHLQAAINYNIPITEDGAYSFYEDVQGAVNGNNNDLKTAKNKGEEAFKSSTLQFILTWTF